MSWSRVVVVVMSSFMWLQSEAELKIDRQFLKKKFYQFHAAVVGKPYSVCFARCRWVFIHLYSLFYLFTMCVCVCV